ncbi:hypothetical protein GGR56DRAFT_647981 [Xylariaceae sp. FL0804]|nr:hypothetical protein GGR56DRAFT_647981 [Xylariaceae sp. FL0804]
MKIQQDTFLSGSRSRPAPRFEFSLVFRRRPDAEYYKCHGQDGMWPFGTLMRRGVRDRNGQDLPTTQLMVDYCSSFVRSLDPNPDVDYLAARGHHSTRTHVEEKERWV